MITKIEDKIKRYIHDNNLIEKGDTIIVGVSGGADSIALLHFLYTHQKEYNIRLKVAHIHHGVREEAIEDAKYVERIAKQYEIPFFIHYCNIHEIAIREKITEEEAGRKERYHFFISLTNEDDKIAVAHNKNDQVETMLMRFIRGSSTKGLAAMRARRQNLIRPLLSISREEIEEYCKHYQLHYQTDHTNEMPIYTRNKIRLKCLPYIKEQINPNVIDTLYAQSQLYQQQSDFIEDYVQNILESFKKTKEEIEIPIERFQKESIYIQKKILLQSMITLSGNNKDIGSMHVHEILKLIDAQTSKKIFLPYGLVSIKRYHTLCIEKQKQKSKDGFDYLLKKDLQKIQEIEAQITTKLVSAKTFEQSKENMYTKYIDYDKIKGNLHVRTRKSGDVITLPSGKKSIKKLFVDEKIPREERDFLPLIADEQEIIWVVGKRLSSKYYVTNETKTIVQIQFIKS